MFRKGTLLIVGMSLCLVLVITLTFMLTNTNGANSQYSKQNIYTEVPEAIKNNIEQSILKTDKESINSSSDQPNNITEKNDKVENDSVEEADSSIEKEERKNETTNTQRPIVTKTIKKEREDKYLNKKTSNTNILCLGIADKELEMISIYSINKENKKSAGIFFPTRTSLKVNGELLTLKQIYTKLGVLTLKEVLSRCLEVDIDYHMVADKQGLVEFSKLIGPIYVENENIDIPNLFIKPVSNKDDAILRTLAQEITQPKMILEFPKLIKIFIENVHSDIGVSGLWDLYKIFKNLNHGELSKIVLWGERVEMANKEYWFIDPYDWHNVVYEMTY